MPTCVTVGDVIRVKSVVASNHPEHKFVLVPTDHSNILFISKVFKLYQKFHKQIECSDYSLDEAILGVAQAPKIQQENTSSTALAEAIPA